MSGVVGLTLDYRDPARTSGCVRNLLEEGAEHVLIWDNSDDGGTSAGALSSEFADDMRVSVVDAEINLGFSAGVNRGIELLKRKCPGRAIVLINNDARLLSGALHALKDALQSTSGALLAFPDIDHSGWVRGTVYYQRLTGVIWDNPMRGTFPYASGCCLLLSPEACNGGFLDEDFFMYGEDWELGWRLSQTPRSMIHVPRLLVRHEGSASSRIGSPFYEAQIVAAQLIMARKLAKGIIDGVLILILHGLWLAVRALARCLRFRSLVPLYALNRGRRIAHKAARRQ